MKQQAQRQLGEKSNSAAPRKEGNVQKVNGLVQPFVLYVFILKLAHGCIIVCSFIWILFSMIPLEACRYPLKEIVHLELNVYPFGSHQLVSCGSDAIF